MASGSLHAGRMPRYGREPVYTCEKPSGLVIVGPIVGVAIACATGTQIGQAFGGVVGAVIGLVVGLALGLLIARWTLGGTVSKFEVTDTELRITQPLLGTTTYPLAGSNFRMARVGHRRGQFQLKLTANAPGEPERSYILGFGMQEDEECRVALSERLGRVRGQDDPLKYVFDE